MTNNKDKSESSLFVDRLFLLSKKTSAYDKRYKFIFEKNNFIYIDIHQLSNSSFRLECTCGHKIVVDVIFEKIDENVSKVFCIYQLEDLESQKLTVTFKGYHSLFCLWLCSRCHEENRMIMNHCNLMTQQRNRFFLESR